MKNCLVPVTLKAALSDDSQQEACLQERTHSLFFCFASLCFDLAAHWNVTPANQNPNQYYSWNEFIIIYQCIRNQECQKIAAKKGKEIQFLSSSPAAPQQATQKTIQATVEDETAEVRADAGTPGLAHFTLSKIKEFSNKMIRYTIMYDYLKHLIPIYCRCKVMPELPGISLLVAVTWPQIASVSINRLGCWRIRECCVWSSHRSRGRCLSAKFKGRLQVFYRVMVQLVIIPHIWY